MPVAANISEIRDQLVSGVDARWAETLRHYPLVDGKADASRIQVDLRGILRVGRGDESNVAGTSTSWGSRIAAGKAEAFFSRTHYPDLVIRDGDKLRATDRAGDPWFQVGSVDDRNQSRLIVELNEI